MWEVKLLQSTPKVNGTISSKLHVVLCDLVALRVLILRQSEREITDINLIWKLLWIDVKQMKTEENLIRECNTKLYTNVEEKDGKGKCRKLFSNFGKWNTKKFRIKFKKMFV